MEEKKRLEQERIKCEKERQRLEEEIRTREEKETLLREQKVNKSKYTLFYLFNIYICYLNIYRSLPKKIQQRDKNWQNNVPKRRTIYVINQLRVNIIAMMLMMIIDHEVKSCDDREAKKRNN